MAALVSAARTGAAGSAEAQAAAFFRKRLLFLAAAVAAFLALNAVCAAYVDYSFVDAIIQVPAGLAWLIVEFAPSAASLEKLGVILPALGSTMLVSVAASCVAAVLAFALAVMGSRSVGLGGPLPLLARGIASLFRNIPVVAWTFVLLFSFKQSEFTGFLALLFTSFGYLVRCFLETVDEAASGPVEALRAVGASYPQIIAQAVIPLTITQVISWVLYMIETNIRDATLVGILTGTGIGFVFDVYYKSFRYDVAGLVILAVIVVVIACEMTSNFVRRRML
ncbi:ABC transporter permease [Adlercreutzia sp. ZJ242]|uniref:PhnE/PtxC family ABC transporter permease n=1 Tax=Adlercreutzia sp. ZJ242 TaxID=2709409 RepID=UPI001F155146|nr:ABC transporter permease subunit [Adlercreutzia sp. ZJ242]